jgi:hypothetical protein
MVPLYIRHLVVGLRNPNFGYSYRKWMFDCNGYTPIHIPHIYRLQKLPTGHWLVVVLDCSEHGIKHDHNWGKHVHISEGDSSGNNRLETALSALGTLKIFEAGMFFKFLFLARGSRFHVQSLITHLAI